MNKKTIISSAILLLLAIPLWLLFAAPQFTKIPEGFTYHADIASHDNFYDETKGDFSGEIQSKTNFFYQYVSSQNGIYLIKNVFDVRAPDDKPIFAVERLYGVDPYTGMHVKGNGDKDREGYLFAPKDLKKGQEYVYWHINYNAPATMKFIGEENILGLTVYHYQANYIVDQTANLGHLPGVPETRGVNNDVKLQVWVEPATGRLINYQDNTLAYYYDIKTGIRLHPWNKFGNTFKAQSIADQIKIAKIEKFKFFLVEKVIPIGALVFALIFLGIAFKRKSST